MTATLLTKELSGSDLAEFNELHPRNRDGEFRAKFGSALRSLVEMYGETINHEEFGEPDHDFSDHGVLALHDDGGITISRTDTEGEGAAGVVASLDGDDASVVQDRVEMALDELDGDTLQPGQHLSMDDGDQDDPFPVSITYGVMSGGTKYVALSDALDEENGESLQLTQEHAREFVESLGALREQQDTYNRDKDNPYIVRPLAEGEQLMRRTKVSSEDRDDILLGIVDTPSGRRLRLGQGGNDALPERSFTGGPGPLVADLGPDEARDLDGSIASALDVIDTYHHNQQVFLERMDEWNETSDGQRLAELNESYVTFRGAHDPAHPDGIHVVTRESYDERGPDGRRAENYVDAPSEIEAEIKRLNSEADRIASEIGVINDEGVIVDTFETETGWGAVVIDVYGWDPETEPDARVYVRPKGVDADEWRDGTLSDYEAYSQMTPKQLKKLAKMVTKAFQDAQGNPIVKSARGTAGAVDRDRIAREGRKYWTRNPKGLAKWAKSAHPWTKLYRHLVTKMDPETARRLTSSYFKAVFGYAPSARQGKNPVGKG